ncbi:DUF3718 domain-containing protein [Alteromonas sp. ASW11-19]|uniref:DUF3718 domain-containing protein n=1 Tax=Alteromonas salexigens TaxID=2982530 RepID=A0ABT2VRX8_9ALTE|nr:DUF3718 domain-containing protein [Alteromonas salexigens]MCU7555804.1 DUF3718 domain-containing protein [Alteromonas salexigens]
MLKIIFRCALVSILLTATFAANADVNRALTNMCEIVKSNDKSELRKKIHNVATYYRMKLNDYYDAVSCDGYSLIRAAILFNALESGSLLIKKMPRGALAAPEADGKTLQAWVAEQGLNNTEIAMLLNDRL